MMKAAIAILHVAAFASAAAPPASLERTAQNINPTIAASRISYLGKPALRLVDRSGNQPLDPIVIVLADGFSDGTILAEVAGKAVPGAAPDARGFIGIAFRVQPGASRYEALYIRPTNGRADDQLRRNHSTQYVSMPDYPWSKLRAEKPGVYESYADLMAGAWTPLKIEVSGDKARFYVNGAEQPSLIVNDLKLGAAATGGVALWIGPGTEGYFRNVRVIPGR